MADQINAYKPPSFAADDFTFIAERMKHMDVPGDYDLGGAAPAPGYRGPIVDDVNDIGRRLRVLETRKKLAPPPPPAPAADPMAGDDWWCC